MSNLPQPYVFAELIGHDLSWQDYETDLEYSYDPEDKNKYELVEQGSEAMNNHGYSEVINYVIIRRIEDETYFKMAIHNDSWSSLDYNCTGDYGYIKEVRPVMKMVFE